MSLDNAVLAAPGCRCRTLFLPRPFKRLPAQLVEGGLMTCVQVVRIALQRRVKSFLDARK